jgi:hypothetical protein
MATAEQLNKRLRETPIEQMYAEMGIIMDPKAVTDPKPVVVAPSVAPSPPPAPRKQPTLRLRESMISFYMDKTELCSSGKLEKFIENNDFKSLASHLNKPIQDIVATGKLNTRVLDWARDVPCPDVDIPGQIKDAPVEELNMLYILVFIQKAHEEKNNYAETRARILNKLLAALWIPKLAMKACLILKLYAWHTYTTSQTCKLTILSQCLDILDMVCNPRLQTSPGTNKHTAASYAFHLVYFITVKGIPFGHGIYAWVTDTGYDEKTTVVGRVMDFLLKFDTFPLWIEAFGKMCTSVRNSSFQEPVSRATNEPMLIRFATRYIQLDDKLDDVCRTVDNFPEWGTFIPVIARIENLQCHPKIIQFIGKNVSGVVKYLTDVKSCAVTAPRDWVPIHLDELNVWLG